MSQLKKGAILSYLKIGLTNIIGLILTPFIIKSLGDSEYGLYTLIGSFVVYLSLMDFGLNNTIIRFVAKYKATGDIDGEKQFLGSIFIIYFLISFFIVLVGVVLYQNLDQIFGNALTVTEMGKAKVMFQILVLNMAIVLPGGAFTAICNSYEKFVWPRLVSIIKYISRAALIFLLLSLGGNAITLVIIDTVLNVLVILLTSIYVIRNLRVKVSFEKLNFKLLKKILNYSIWIFILAITSHFLWNTGQVILGVKTDTKTVAYYAVGILLGNYYASFSGAISGVFLPKATQMSLKSSKKEILSTMIKIGRISLQILLFILTGFFLFGKEFIHWWVGENYTSSYTVAVIIMIVYTIPLILNFANSLIEAYDKVKYKVIVYTIFFSMGIILGYLLIPIYNEIGMIIGLAVGWLFAQLIMLKFYHQKLELNMYSFFYRTFDKILLPVSFLTIVGYIINHFLSQNFIFLLFKMIIYTISYWSVLYLFSMNNYERNILRKRI